MITPERDIVTHEVDVDGEPVYARMHKSVELTEQVIADIRAVTRSRRRLEERKTAKTFDKIKTIMATPNPFLPAEVDRNTIGHDQ